MDDMPRPRPPHLHRQVSRHGKTVWYVRFGKGPRTRIRSAFWHPRIRRRVSGGDAMRGLFRWAVKAKLVKSNPTAGVDNTPRPKTDGFPVWTDDDIAVYGARWPIGTQQRVWLDVLVYTGLRRGDAVRFGRQHIRNGVGTIKTEKTDTVVTLPILPVLSKTLDAGPCGDLTFIAGENGRPLARVVRQSVSQGMS